MTTDSKSEAYWKANLRLLTILLAIWFIVSYGFGILFAGVLNNITFFGYKLGFWFAQQGAIYTFLLLILFYVVRMGQIDREFDVHEE